MRSRVGSLARSTWSKCAGRDARSSVLSFAGSGWSRHGRGGWSWRWDRAGRCRCGGAVRSPGRGAVPVRCAVPCLERVCRACCRAYRGGAGAWWSGAGDWLCVCCWPAGWPVWSGESLALWAGGSRLAGNGRLRGQILVRPPAGSGAVRSAAVRLVPVAPAGRLAGLLFALGAPAPEVVGPDVDHAGRWNTVRSVPGWSYAVVVEAEGCSPQMAGRCGCVLAAERVGGTPDGVVPLA